MLKAALRSVLGVARGILRRFPALQKMRYDLFNQGVFTGLDWHERMLIDAVRVNAYRAGITAGVTSGDVVIDLGTGTGVLATFAARAGARQVYAIDHSDFIAIAETIAQRNDVRTITFVKQNSRDFSPPEKVDVIIHEQMGHTLFNENMILNLLDLKRRALKPDGRILPGQFELLAAPVSLKDEYRRPFLWEIDVHGIDLNFLEHHALMQPYQTQEHRQRLLKCFEVEAFLAPPRALLSFDINQLESEASLATRHDVEWVIDTPGAIDGICFFFRTTFDDGTSFDTSPFSRQTNWENALIRTSRNSVVRGQLLRRTLVLDPLPDWARWQVLDAATGARA
jgi:type I protein arginine methyltransferase